MTEPSSGRAWANRLTRMLDQVLGSERFPVDVTALALNYSRQCFADPITMVKGAALDGFEGGLFRKRTGKAEWSIVYNDALPVRGRINFVLAHELGHYLRHRHQLDEFLCSQRDMVDWDREDQARETDANQFASYLLMPIGDFRRQLSGQKITVDVLGHCANRYGVSFTAAILKWLEFTDERAVLVIARDGFILWSRSSEPALRSGAYFRTRNIVCPVPEMSVASGQWGAGRKREAVAIPSGRMVSSRSRGRDHHLLGPVRYDDQLASIGSRSARRQR
ncbi:MAG: ImmA/IrrE family metallo-endopeptidase [Rhodospirillales bacterium]|nr:ImmA/IrrE family metallo-endopeptidase [Rhodospirillales bacterium]